VLADLLTQAAAYLQSQGAQTAIAADRRALEIYEAIIGPDAARSLTCRGQLAGDYRMAGRYGEAATLDEQTQADRTRVLGADHPDTLDSCHGLMRARLKRLVGRHIPTESQPGLFMIVQRSPASHPTRASSSAGSRFESLTAHSA